MNAYKKEETSMYNFRIVVLRKAHGWALRTESAVDKPVDVYYN